MELLRQILLVNISTFTLILAAMFWFSFKKKLLRLSWGNTLNIFWDLFLAGWFCFLSGISIRDAFGTPEDPSTGVLYLAITAIIANGFAVAFAVMAFKKNKHKIIEWHKRGNLLCRPHEVSKGYKNYF